MKRRTEMSLDYKEREPMKVINYFESDKQEHWLEEIVV